jgi:2-methylisocitrate lyase-like PEP mutase family enzyme
MISAKVADQLGFHALYMTGYGVSASHLGLPDAGLAGYTDMQGRARTIANGISSPLIADADTGFGGLINIRHTVRGYEEAGVQAIQLEDQESPKKCGHTPNRRVVPQADAVRRIEVAVDARRSTDTLIIARTDARTGTGLDEAIHRGKAFAKAGADIIFVESPESVDEFKRIGQELQGTGAWLIANMVPTGRSPELSAKQLQALGFSLAIWPGAVMAVAAAATKNALRYLAENGTTAGSPVPMIDMKELHELVGFQDVWDFEKKYVEQP